MESIEDVFGAPNPSCPSGWGQPTIHSISADVRPLLMTSPHPKHNDIIPILPHDQTLEHPLFSYLMREVSIEKKPTKDTGSPTSNSNTGDDGNGDGGGNSASHAATTSGQVGDGGGGGGGGDGSDGRETISLLVPNDPLYSKWASASADGLEGNGVYIAEKHGTCKGVLCTRMVYVPLEHGVEKRRETLNNSARAWTPVCLSRLPSVS